MNNANMSHKRIHIIGGPGSGKSQIAGIVSEKYSIPVLDLDTIFWDNRSSHYGIKADPLERDKVLNSFVDQNSWIVEGVYYAWVGPSFQKTNLIVALTTSVWLRDVRIIRRFLKRKFGLASSKKKETLKGLFELLKWNHGYDRKNLKQARSYITELGYNVKDCKSSTDVLKLAKEITSN
jgi:adenylate kinase family enzyme